MARPIDLTSDITEGVANLIRAGNVPLRAAMAKGVPRSTWYSWLARGRAAAARREDELEMPDSEQQFLELLDTVERAESESQVIAISHLQKAMPSTPTAVFAFLERRFPAEWGNRAKVELVGEVGVRPLPAIVELERPRLEDIAGGKAKRTKRSA